MSKSRGEGRSNSEKSQRVFTTRESLKKQAEARKAEEQRWADLCGPVEVKKKEG